MLKKILFAILLSPALLATVAQPAFAWQKPDFGTCLNPQVGASQVNTGSDHGVVGYSGAFSGTDSIYSLSDGNVMQCLCADNGAGYQTNWWKVAGMSDQEVRVHENEGWTYFADAGSWGLDGAYLAKTSTYVCAQVTPTCTPTPTPIVSETPTPTPTSTPGPTNTPTPGPTNTPTPKAQSNAVLGLASTGNVTFLYFLTIAGAASLILGLVLRKFSK